MAPTGKCDCGETTTEDHVDGNQDGICDKCKTCLHTKDEKGNCTLGKDCKHIKDGLDCCKYEEEPEAKYTYHLYYDFNYTGTGSTKWDIKYGPTAETSLHVQGRQPDADLPWGLHTSWLG